MLPGSYVFRQVSVVIPDRHGSYRIPRCAFSFYISVKSRFRVAVHKVFHDESEATGSESVVVSATEVRADRCPSRRTDDGCVGDVFSFFLLMSVILIFFFYFIFH